MFTYFISDIHLQLEEPNILKIFFDFLAEEAPKAEALYILGDLFEAWVGDDDNAELPVQVRAALKTLTHQIPVFFICGNRDFLLGHRFEQETGVQILQDPYIVELYETRLMLSHGDIFCTDDLAYQAFRKKTQDPKFRWRLLLLPLFLRRWLAKVARQKSKKHTKATNLMLQDVNTNAVIEAMEKENVKLLIHGHTHRPGVSEMKQGKKLFTRIVLPAWHEKGGALKYDNDHQYEFKVLK
jgi:UDP-2,3-diacylglucosamine hydrolase